MKYKSYGFWTALAGAVTLFAGTLAKCFGISFNVAIIEDCIMAFAGILVVLGIVCMPIDKEKNPENVVEKDELSSSKNDEIVSIDKENMKENKEENIEDNNEENIEETIEAGREEDKEINIEENKKK